MFNKIKKISVLSLLFSMLMAPTIYAIDSVSLSTLTVNDNSIEDELDEDEIYSLGTSSGTASYIIDISDIAEDYIDDGLSVPQYSVVYGYKSSNDSNYTWYIVRYSEASNYQYKIQIYNALDGTDYSIHAFLYDESEKNVSDSISINSATSTVIYNYNTYSMAGDYGATEYSVTVGGKLSSVTSDEIYTCLNFLTDKYVSVSGIQVQYKNSSGVYISLTNGASLSDYYGTTLYFTRVATSEAESALYQNSDVVAFSVPSQGYAPSVTSIYYVDTETSKLTVNAVSVGMEYSEDSTFKTSTAITSSTTFGVGSYYVRWSATATAPASYANAFSVASSASAVSPAIAISTSGNSTIEYGTSTYPTFTVSVTDGSSAPYEYSYVWYRNGSIISGATDTSYTETSDLNAGTYTYYCRVTATRTDVGSAISSTSSSVRLTVSKAETPYVPYIVMSDRTDTTITITSTESLLDDVNIVSDNETYGAVMYSIDGGENWQYSETFIDLLPGTEYEVIGKYISSTNFNESEVGDPVTVETRTEAVSYNDDIASSIYSNSETEYDFDTEEFLSEYEDAINKVQVTSGMNKILLGVIIFVLIAGISVGVFFIVKRVQKKKTTDDTL